MLERRSKNGVLSDEVHNGQCSCDRPTQEYSENLQRGERVGTWRELSAPLDTPYGIGDPRRALPLDTLTIAPPFPPRSTDMRSAATRQQLSTPKRFVSRHDWMAARSASASDPSNVPSKIQGEKIQKHLECGCIVRDTSNAEMIIKTKASHTCVFTVHAATSVFQLKRNPTTSSLHGLCADRVMQSMFAV